MIGVGGEGRIYCVEDFYCNVHHLVIRTIFVHGHKGDGHTVQDMAKFQKGWLRVVGRSARLLKTY